MLRDISLQQEPVTVLNRYFTSELFTDLDSNEKFISELFRYQLENDLIPYNEYLGYMRITKVFFTDLKEKITNLEDKVYELEDTICDPRYDSRD